MENTNTNTLGIYTAHGIDLNGNIISSGTFPSGGEPILLGSYTFSAKRMGGAPTISASFKYPYDLKDKWTGKEYVTFRGENFFLKSKPSVLFDNTSVLYKHDCTFIGERSVLDTVYFFDTTTTIENGETKALMSSSSFSYYGNIESLANKINSSLLSCGLNDGNNVGYRIVIDEGVTSESKLFTFSNNTITEVLNTIYEELKLTYYFVGREIHIGDYQNEISQEFSYGANNELLSINKVNKNNRIITSITGVGSSDNIPYYYPNETEKGQISITSNNCTVEAKRLQRFIQKVDAKDRIEYTSGDCELDAYAQAILKSPRFESVKVLDKEEGRFDVDVSTDSNPMNDSSVNYCYFNFKQGLRVTQKGFFNFEITKTNNEIPITEVRLLRKKEGEEKFDTLIKKWKISLEETPAYIFEVGYLDVGEYIVDFDVYYSSEAREKSYTDSYSVKVDSLQSWYNFTKGEIIHDLDDIGVTVSNIVENTIPSFSYEVESYHQPQKNLMPPIYRDGERFYNATDPTIYENVYDENNPQQYIQDFPDVKPTIKNVVFKGSQIDLFEDFAYDKNDDDSTIVDGENMVWQHPYFFAKLKPLGFNLFDCAIDEDEMVVSFTEGNCGACEFIIGVSNDGKQKNLVQVDEYGNLLKDKDGDVICNRKSEKFKAQEIQNDTTNNSVWIALKKDVDTFGIIMPNRTQGLLPTTDDHFVLTHILLPQTYIDAAEEKLEKELLGYMKENNYEQFNFNIKLSRIYLEENKSILESLSENSKIKITYNSDINNVNGEGNSSTYGMYVSSYSYKVAENELLPEITIDVSENVVTSKNAIKKAIDGVRVEFENKLSGGASYESMITNESPLATSGGQYGRYVRKDVDDVVNGNITFYQNIEVREDIEAQKDVNVGANLTVKEDLESKNARILENLDLGTFVKGVSGANLGLNEEGYSTLEVDYLKVRLKAYFDTLVIQESETIGGRVIISPAGSIVCTNVLLESSEEIGSYYRCYFQTSQGDSESITTLENLFQVGDLAFHKSYNISDGNRMYWREVVGIGSNYIDLSDSGDGFLGGSDAPQANDVICHLGNSNAEVKRGNAIILSSIEDSSPSIILYQNIDKFSLEGKDIVAMGVDSNGKAFHNVYGNAYVGDRLDVEEDTTQKKKHYMKYTPEDGLEISGKLTVGTTYDGKEIAPKEYVDKKANEALNKFGEYEYIKAALGKSTEIDGGLILSSTILLRDGNGNVMAGSNGTTPNGDESIAFWAGGQMLDREKEGNEDNENAADYLVRMDGSGYFSKGGIRWDKNGNLFFSEDIKVGDSTTLANIISGISEINEKISDWFTLKDGVLKTKYNLASEKAVSTKGVGSSSGSGGVVPWGEVENDIIPKVTDTYNIGSESKKWKTIYAISGYFNVVNAQSLDAVQLTINGKDVATKEYVEALIGSGGGGGESGGSSTVSYIQSISSGKEIGTLIIDGTSHTLYAPNKYVWEDIDGKPTFSAVTETGKYEDLTGTPTKLSDFEDDVVSGNYQLLITDTNRLPYTLISGAPTIYSLTIQKNGIDVGTYTPTNEGATINLDDVASDEELQAHIGNKNNPHEVTKSQVGLGNVENTALSTWVGSSNIKTVGVITSGTWNGTKIANDYLSNSAITIAGTSVSLGGSITVDTLNTKLGISTGALSTLIGNNLTVSRVLVSNADGKIAVSSITTTELGYLDGVTSSIQTQLNNLDARIESVEGWFTLEDGVLKTIYPIASEGAISTKGVGSSSGGGTSYERLDSWDNYDASAGAVLSATLGYELKQAIERIDVEDIDLSDYYNRTEVNNLLSQKQAVISDLDNIREGAEKGSTALQASDLDGYAKTSDIPTNVSELTNDSGYIKGITSSDVITALGYTPFNNANFTKAKIKSTLGISDWALALSKPSYTTTEVTEGNNLYFTNARALSALKSTTDALSSRISVFEEMFVWGDDAKSYIRALKAFASDYAISTKGLGSGGGGGGTIDLSNVVSNITPSIDSTYSIGTTTKAWKNIYADSIYMNGNLVATSGDIDTLVGSLGSLAFKSSLVASDIPSLSWSKITSGKPTTVSGYGITDAITTANIGSQSVNYATSAGDANTLGGLSSVNIFRQLDTNPDINTYGDSSNKNGIIYINTTIPSAINAPFAYGSILSINHNAASWMVACSSSGSLQFRNRWWSNDGNDWTNWKQFAFTDSNVASATKLEDNTAFTVWGQTFFTGGKPKSVSGALSNTGSITPSATHTYNIGSTTEVYERIYGRYIDTDSGYDLRLSTGGTQRMQLVASNGNVLIGTTTDSGYKLYVNGTTYLKSLTLDSPSITLTGDTEDIGIITTGTTYSLLFGVGAGNVNRGIYDYTNSSWLMYRDDTTDVLFPQGNVMIGTTYHQDYKLYVNGGIATKEIYGLDDSNNAVWSIDDVGYARFTRFYLESNDSSAKLIAGIAGNNIRLQLQGEDDTVPFLIQNISGSDLTVSTYGTNDNTSIGGDIFLIASDLAFNKYPFIWMSNKNNDYKNVILGISNGSNRYMYSLMSTGFDGIELTGGAFALTSLESSAARNMSGSLFTWDKNDNTLSLNKIYYNSTLGKADKGIMSLSLNGYLNVSSNATVSGSISIGGGAQIYTYLAVSLNDDGATELFRVDSNGTSVGSSLCVEGTTTLSDKLTISKNGMSVTGAAYFGGGTTYYFGSTGNIYANTLNASATTLRSTLSVAGATTFNSSVTIGGARLYWDSNTQTLMVDKSVASTGSVSSRGIDNTLYKKIDLSGYSENYFYPVVGSKIYPNQGFVKINVRNNLDTNIPSWSTHTSGFTANMEIYCTSSGWGITGAETYCTNYSYHYAKKNPVGFSQMTNASKPVLWLRGGGIYKVYTSVPITWTPKSESYTESSQTVTPQNASSTTAPFSFSKSTIYGDFSGNIVGSINTLTISPSNTTSYQDGLVLHDKGYGDSEALRIKWTSASYTTGVSLYADLKNKSLLFNNGTATYNILHSGGINNTITFNAVTGIDGEQIIINGDRMYGMYQGSEEWSITAAGSATFNEVTQSSDINLKNIIQDVRLSLGSMVNAPLVLFDWMNRNNEKHHVGTIAQYWNTVLPEVVSTTKNGTLALDYSTLGVAIGLSLSHDVLDLVSRIDNTDSEIDKLKARVEALENENKELRAMIA